MDTAQKILSDIVVWSKYAKHIPELNRRESWDEIVDRNVAMHIKKYPFLRKRIQEVYNQFVRPKKVLPSMRSLQFGGAPIEISNVRIFNCSFLPIDHPFAFAETMFLLLSGTGVGYSVQKHHVEKLPTVVGPTEKHRRFLIGDSIEGWAEAIKVLVKAYTQGKSNPDFDYRDIRPKGAKLVTAGGKAPGPAPLRICLEQLRAILNSAIGRKLTTLEAHDMLCHIADTVLSGGIRRAAMISLFDRDDMDMLSSKAGNWWEMNPQRGRANNSAVLPRGEVSYEQFMDIWSRVKDSGSGEPGFYWTNDKDWGTNPCISGDALVTVCDHGVSGESTGLPYKIPMKMLVDVVNTSDLPPFALSFNASTGEKEWKPILAAALTKRNAEMIQVEADGRVLKCTPDHKIFTKNRGWVEAQYLEETDELVFN